jgi:hypothetical protein
VGRANSPNGESPKLCAARVAVLCGGSRAELCGFCWEYADLGRGILTVSAPGQGRHLPSGVNRTTMKRRSPVAALR